MFYKEEHKQDACGWGYCIGEIIHELEEEAVEVVEKVEDFVEDVIKDLEQTIIDMSK